MKAKTIEYIYSRIRDEQVSAKKDLEKACQKKNENRSLGFSTQYDDRARYEDLSMSASIAEDDYNNLCEALDDFNNDRYCMRATSIATIHLLLKEDAENMHNKAEETRAALRKREKELGLASCTRSEKENDNEYQELLHEYNEALDASVTAAEALKEFEAEEL